MDTQSDLLEIEVCTLSFKCLYLSQWIALSEKKLPRDILAVYSSVP